MRGFLSAALLLVLSVRPGLSQTPQHSTNPIHFAIECDELAGIASTYLTKHGIFVFPKSDGLSIQASQGKRDTPWTDAQGKTVNDFKVYWDFSNKSSGEKEIFGLLWHLRLSHYWGSGLMKLDPDAGGCNVDFRLRFETSGADVVVILPLDSSWVYESNGRMEREYLDGISAELDRRKSVVTKPK